MEETNWLCTLLKKLNINILIFSFLVALLVYALTGIEIIWSIIILCTCYLLTYGAIKGIGIYQIKSENRKYTKERNIRIAQEEQDKIRAYNTIFESLSNEYKRTLIELFRYKKTEGGYVNERILPNGSNLQNRVSNLCHQLHNQFWDIDLIQEKCSIGSSIILINKELYLVLEEKSKTFEM